MTDNQWRRKWRHAVSLAVLGLVASTVTACGGARERTAAAHTETPGAHAESSEGPAPTQATASRTDAPRGPASGPAERGEDKQAQERAAEERRNSAPSGDLITSAPRHGIPQGAEKFGTAVAEQGDLTVYAAKREGAALVVPCKITNSGDRRAAYAFRIRVTGPGGYNATAQASLDTVGLYPGTSWPTELTVRQSGTPVPAHPKITVERLQRTELRQ